MIWHPTKDAVQRLWGRRWVRRVSYVLVAGATTLTVVPWVASRPAVLRWSVSKLDALVRDETGLPLLIGHLEIHPILGLVVLRDVRWGDQFVTVDRIEMRADPLSMFGPAHRIFSIRVDHPKVRLTEATLSALKFKVRPPRQGPLPKIQLDLLTLSGGEIDLPEPLRGLPAAHYRFEVKAIGQGPNQWRVNVTGPELSVVGPAGREAGRLDLHGDVSELSLRIREAYLRLGDSQMRLSGQFQPKSTQAPERVDAQFSGVLGLAQTFRWAGQGRPPLTGRLEVAGTVQGSLTTPRWSLKAEGTNLKPTDATLQPGVLGLRAEGGLTTLRVEQLNWRSPQGQLALNGSWSNHAPPEGTFSGQDLDLNILGRHLRLTELKGVRGNARLTVRGPTAAADLARLDRWQAALDLSLTQGGRPAGALRASLKDARLVLEPFQFDLETLKAAGIGWATFGRRGLQQLEGVGQVEVGAGQVAQVLRGWKVADLDMEAQARATATVRWNAVSGFELDGSCDLTAPRWHGAKADLIQTRVSIRGSELRVTDIDLRKDEGRGAGELWLTWADTAPGQNQMDMCYTAFRLPVAEGLRAADLKDDQGLDLPITGTASGWVRLQGPYDHLRMDGQAQVESGQVYEMTIPAASSDFSMVISELHMQLRDARIAERADLLGSLRGEPEGALALRGQADMDFARSTWWVDLTGRFDSQLLSLPGPHLQAQIDGRLLGPLTRPFGPLDLPEGRLTLSRGRVFFGGRSLEGLEGGLSLERGRLEGHLGLEGMKMPVAVFKARQEGLDLTGDLTLKVSSDSARTENLARSLTEDLMEDLSLEASVQGRWNAQGLQWSGSLNRLAAQFNAFELHQARPSSLQGDTLGAQVDISLEGGARQPADPTSQAASLRLTGTIPFSATAPLVLRAQGTANLAHMKSIFDRLMELDEYSLLSELKIQGLSRFDLLAHGTVPEPLLDGTLSLENGQMILRRYQGAEDLSTTMIFKDRTVTIPETSPLRGTLAHGDLEVSGNFKWQLGGLESYSLKASLANFQLRDVPDGLDLQGTLRATLEGGEERSLLKGRLRADRLSYQTEVKLADLILRSALSDGGGLTGLDLDDPLDRIRLDLDLDLRSPWTFDTNLLKLEGRTEGPFQVVGTLAHPVPKGTMVFQPGGRVTNIFPAGDMVVNRGSLAFSDLRPLDPVINLEGSVTSIPGYTVNLDIHGTLSNLAIVPSSTPSLRQDEIVAILINPGNVANVGTAGSSSGATQGAITSGLASAGTGLVSTLAFTPFQEQLRRTFGLDRVNVAVRTTSLGTTETEVTLGKSLTLLGQRSAFVVSHRKTGELNITSGQVEWRFGGLILQLGFSKGGSAGLLPSGEIRHSWSPK